MPSRKRAKGRERKLKQQTREPVERSVSQPPLNGGNINLLVEQNFRRIELVENDKCDHGGYLHKGVRGHPVTHFNDLFMEILPSIKDCDVSVTNFMHMTFVEHHEVWKDFAMRKMAIDTIVSMGTGLIIVDCIIVARMISEAIIYLEKYTSEDTYDSVLSKATEDVGYLLNAGDKDVIRFYYKRITCSCLDELYSKIKKIEDRVSECFHCNQTVKRKDLKICNRCKYAQYCSKECQTLGWPSHEKKCKTIANIHDRANKVEAARSSEGI